MKISERITDLNKFIFNPGLMQRAALQTLKDVTNGTIDIVDPSNPFVFALESAVCNTVAFIQHNEAVNRRLYPTASVNIEDLYYHMSDKDYIGRFALPSRLMFTLAFDKDELLNSLILDTNTGIKKMRIPRNSKFTVGSTDFSLQYPIEIRELQHGGLQIVYVNDIISPLYELETNVIDFEESNSDGVNYIIFSFLTHQFNIITKYQTVNKSTGFITRIPFVDDFYYARIYLLDSNNKWNEILTTHTEQVYNVNYATAVLQVNDKELVVKVPSIYTDSGLVNGKMRIDLYQTKGKLDLNMSNYKLTDFSATWLAIDENDQDQYNTIINNLKTIVLYSDKTTSGGRAALSKKELMDRVINNSVGPQNLPITNVQLENSIIDAGYTFVKNIDTITNRVFLATREMVEPIDNRLVTPASSSVSRITLTLAEANLAYGVNVVGNRVIITSDALYKNTNGIIKLVSTSDYNYLNTLSNTLKASILNAGDYVYSPFYYVLDTINNSFNVRPYYLDNPEILTKNFVEENPLTGVQVNISSNYSIEKTNTGYILTLQTKSNDLYKELEDSTVFCQIAFKTEGQAAYSYMTGTQLDRAADTDERVYVFNLDSDFDINENDQLAQNAFQFNNSNVSNYSDLLQEFQVFFISNNSRLPSVDLIEADDLIGKFQLPATSIAITHEKIKIRFGYFLDYLWARAKSISTSLTYRKYEQDVLAYYKEDVYEQDPVTGAAFSVVNDQLVYNIIHRKGDPILDTNGQQLVLHRQGDTMLNLDGEPIPVDVNGDSITRYIDIATIEGVYRFTTDPSSNAYKKTMVQAMVDWIINDIPNFNLTALDQTRIFFYPKITQGYINCLVGDGKTLNIPINQSMRLNLHVPSEVYNNSDLREELNRISVVTINQMLNTKTIAVSDIEYALKDKYGNDVIDVQLEGLGPNNEYNAVTILDDSAKMSIRKKLVVLPDNSIILEEDVTINYILHSTTV